MLRSFLIPFSCVFFAACSSSDDSALNEWFNNQNYATSYGKDSIIAEVLIKSDLKPSFDSSAYMVSSYAALGKVNDIEQSLYFGLDSSAFISDSLITWKLRADTAFYKEFNNMKIPDELDAIIYWLKENKTEHDSTWLKFLKNFEGSGSDTIKIKLKSGGGVRDTLVVDSLPPELLKLKGSAALIYIKLLSEDAGVLRISPPSIADIPGLLRVAQKTEISDECPQCLHAGVRESLSVVFKIEEKYRKDIAEKTIVFAELVFPKISSDTAGSELGKPVPVYVYNENGLEEYRVDSAYVKKHGHPNLIFWEGDSLKLQVTNSLRNYAISASPPDFLRLTLRLGFPVLEPKSSRFYNHYGQDGKIAKVFSDRPAYSKYDFSNLEKGKKAELKLWFADYGDKN